MLDRAERIFLDLANAKTHSATALRTLMDIYQQEKNWDNAIASCINIKLSTKQNMQPASRIFIVN